MGVGPSVGGHPTVIRRGLPWRTAPKPPAEKPWHGRGPSPAGGAGRLGALAQGGLGGAHHRGGCEKGAAYAMAAHREGRASQWTGFGEDRGAEEVAGGGRRGG